MRPRYFALIELSNQGAREMGFKDVGALWRGGYDMTPDEFSADLERLWNQVRSAVFVTAYVVRRSWSRSMAECGPAGRSDSSASARQYLGTGVGNIYDLTGVKEDKTGVDVTELLKKKKSRCQGHVKYGEGFFTSMGFEKTAADILGAVDVYEAGGSGGSLPRQRMDIDNKDDLRIKCASRFGARISSSSTTNSDNNFLSAAYKNQPPLFRTALTTASMRRLAMRSHWRSRRRLQKVGLLESVPQGTNDVPELLKQALDRVAFLPFGLLIDQWRWKVFSARSSRSTTTRPGGICG